MKIEVKVIEEKYHEVDINPKDILSKIFIKWINSVDEKFDYIEDGYWWSSIEHYYGSVSFRKQRAATKDEQNRWEAFKIIKDLIEAIK